jgi:hypothetical protein
MLSNRRSRSSRVFLEGTRDRLGTKELRARLSVAQVCKRSLNQPQIWIRASVGNLGLAMKSLCTTRANGLEDSKKVAVETRNISIALAASSGPNILHDGAMMTSP